MAVAERDEPSMTAISPKNSPLPSVTMTVLLGPFILAISTLPSSTTNSSRPVEPSSKMTSSTSNSLMHFSMVMVATAFLAGRSMLIGKQTGANGTSRMPQGSMGGSGPGRPMFGGQNRAGRVPKISVRPPPVRIWQAIKVTKWSINSGESNVSDQQSQPTSGETGTLGAAPAVPATPAPGEPVTPAAEAEPARRAPGQEETSPKPDAPKVEAVEMEAPKVEASKAEAPKMDAPKIDAPKIDAVKPEAPRFPSNLTIMSPGERLGADAKAASAEASSGKRRFGAMAAVVALATVAGALGGALATAGVGKLMAGDSAQASAQTSEKDSALEASVARLHGEIRAPETNPAQH